MKTLNELCELHDVEVPAHLVAAAEIPVLTGIQRQGDVIVVPMKPGNVDGLKAIPAEGVPVVRGESGGNTHLLVGAGLFAPKVVDQVMGTLVVGDEPAYLLHPEHGATGIGRGTYIVSRQREQADVQRLVAD